MLVFVSKLKELLEKKDMDMLLFVWGACTHLIIKSFLFYRYVMANNNCLTWVSSEDTTYRDHCYWYESSLEPLGAYEADYICSWSKGNLAPYIDSLQYGFLLSLRPPDTTQTFIGVTDQFSEGHWTQFDGSLIPQQPPFDETMSQPDASQNCAVINPSLTTSEQPIKMQDTPCTEEIQDPNQPRSMLCYTNENNYCLHWNSTDGYRRYQCYWFINSENYWSYYDVIKECAAQGGSIAPVIDEEQLSFLRNTYAELQKRSELPSTTFSWGLVWLGANTFRRQQVSNWNRSPYLLNDSTFPVMLGQETCSHLYDIYSPVKFISCSNREIVNGAFCIRSSSASAPQSNNDNSSTGTTVAAVPTSTTYTTVEDIKLSLSINKRKTHAHISKLTSAPDDRISSKSIGVLGVGMLVCVCFLIVFPDCINVWRELRDRNIFIVKKNAK